MSKVDSELYWYVLFCKTGYEEKLAIMLNKYLKSENFTSFILRKTCVFRRHGKSSIFWKNCFPGYIFFESKMPAIEFFRYVHPLINGLKDAYRLLCYGENRYDIAMKEEERCILNKMFGETGCIDISTGFKEGDSIKIIEGALAGNESKILKINKNRKNAIIILELFGSSIEVSVGLDVINKK